MRTLITILLSIAFISCMETDARVLQLQAENSQLENEIMDLVDSIEVMTNDMKLQIVNLNATIQAKDNSFDSLMTLWNEKLSDTTYLDTLRSRLVKILN